jgi:hypothetical protein
MTSPNASRTPDQIDVDAERLTIDVGIRHETIEQQEAAEDSERRANRDADVEVHASLTKMRCSVHLTEHQSRVMDGLRRAFQPAGAILERRLSLWSSS